jgi:hypothetical protein
MFLHKMITLFILKNNSKNFQKNLNYNYYYNDFDYIKKSIQGLNLTSFTVFSKFLFLFSHK